MTSENSVRVQCTAILKSGALCPQRADFVEAVTLNAQGFEAAVPLCETHDAMVDFTDSGSRPE